MKERLSPKGSAIYQFIWSLVFLTAFPQLGDCQSSPLSNDKNTVTTIDTLNKNRLKTLLVTGGSLYTLGSVGLYATWYRDFPMEGFHFFDDFGQWSHLDKVGHIYSSYGQSELLHRGFRWTGMDDNKAMWYGIGGSLLFQTTIEVFDGFSSEWGFSVSDFGANIIGAGAYGVQQHYWGEQRIRLKFSTDPTSNSRRNGEIDATVRAEELFGSSILEQALKDYNRQTYWLSVNPKTFYPKSSIPSWLNVAVGYGADNLLGGFNNVWEEQGTLVDATDAFRRHQQFYLSLDMDLSKIKTESKFLRTVLDVLNYIKVPFSAIEINTLGQVRFHFIQF